MTDDVVAMPEVAATPAVAWDDSSGGVDWHVELDRAVLLPGRLVGGRVSVASRGGTEARALVIALVATEHWRHEVTHHNADGTTRTEVVTSRDEVVRVPVQVRGPVRLGPGERLDATFELPVPAMGPATLEADDAGLEWAIEAKLDVDNFFDARTERPVVVAQPTALLRAGAVHVGQFALYEGADVASSRATGTITLQPMPLVCGEPFEGRVVLQLGGSVKVQEIRAELRVEVEATVSGGERETITAWSAVLAPEGTYQGTLDVPISGSIGPRALPTVVLPHGRASATFHVVLAIAWSPDTHLARDVTLATTREI